jgi:hypothetical protein
MCLSLKPCSFKRQRCEALNILILALGVSEMQS